jgi:hypothetical protein
MDVDFAATYAFDCIAEMALRVRKSGRPKFKT